MQPEQKNGRIPVINWLPTARRPPVVFLDSRTCLASERLAYTKKRRSPGQQPGTKSAHGPADKPLIKSVVNQFSTILFKYCFLSLRTIIQEGCLRCSGRQRWSVVSWAHQHSAIPSHSVPPHPAPPRSAAERRPAPPCPARGIPGFWTRQVRSKLGFLCSCFWGDVQDGCLRCCGGRNEKSSPGRIALCTALPRSSLALLAFLRLSPPFLASPRLASPNLTSPRLAPTRLAPTGPPRCVRSAPPAGYLCFGSVV